jgi:hypothetical protein
MQIKDSIPIQMRIRANAPYSGAGQMERIKYLIGFFFLALAGAGFTYLDFALGRVGPTLDLALAGPAAVVVGVGGFFYQIYMLIYDAWHRGDAPTANAAANIVDRGMGPDLAATKAGSITYGFRPGFFSKEISYRLEENSLGWDGGVAGELAFSNIRRIRIYESAGGKSTPEFQRCIITTQNGKNYSLSSNHCIYLGFESRMSSYQPFIDELFRRVQSKNPSVEYWVGFSPGVHWALTATIVATAMVFCLIAAVPIFVVSDQSGQDFWLPLLFSPFMLGIGAFSIIPAWRSLQRNRPRRFDPRTEIPLPQLAAPAAHRS